MQSLKQTTIILIISVALLQWNIGCSEAQWQQNSEEISSLDIATIEQVTGMTGIEQEGQYKLTVPQNDLDVSVNDFSIVPPMGMGSWAAFSPAGDDAMLMGDIVVKEDEIADIQQVLISNGLKVTALHNHFVREEPSVMYMHIGGQGTGEELAKGVKAVFDEIEESRGENPAEAETDEVENTLNTDRITNILGHDGDMDRGVYKVTIGRPDVDLEHEGDSVSTFMGFNTWASWQGTPDNAAVAGDFVMLADEVDGVIEALVTNDIEVVALHNHMIHEEPRVFFLHYWGTGPAKELAQGLRQALDQTGVNQ